MGKQRAQEGDLEGVSCETLFRPPRLPEDTDNSEDILLLAYFKEGSSRFCG